MLNPFICGSVVVDDVDDEEPPAAAEAAKKSKKTHSNKTNKKKNKSTNPFSNRGLDKFSSLLEHLEEKKQKVYKKLGSSSSAEQEDTLMVRFAYSNAKDWVPIVVKKDRKLINPNPSPKARPNRKAHNVVDNDGDPDPHHDHIHSKEAIQDGDVKEKNRTERRCSSYYWLLLVILEVLVCFVMCGRFFAVSCTSLLWFLLPKMKKDVELKSTKSMKKRKSLRWSPSS